MAKWRERRDAEWAAPGKFRVVWTWAGHPKFRRFESEGEATEARDTMIAKNKIEIPSSYYESAHVLNIMKIHIERWTGSAWVMVAGSQESVAVND